LGDAGRIEWTQKKHASPTATVGEGQTRRELRKKKDQNVVGVVAGLGKAIKRKKTVKVSEKMARLDGRRVSADLGKVNMYKGGQRLKQASLSTSKGEIKNTR